jgi:hypothetical protein
MVLILGTGHPWHAIHGNLTPLPLLGLCVTLILIRFVLGQPIGIVAAAVSVALGTSFSTAADAWGLTVTLTMWLVGALILAGPIGRARSGLGGEPRN